LSDGARHRHVEEQRLVALREPREHFVEGRGQLVQAFDPASGAAERP